VADEPEIEDAGRRLGREFGGNVDAVEADLATTQGVDRLWGAIHNRPVAALLANAGRGLGEGFPDQDFGDVRHVVDTNITGTIDLIQRVAKDMRTRGEGRILITGSVAGSMPGSFQAVYNATKAFIHSFSLALRTELKDTGITVTCLMPGATETGSSSAPICSTKRSARARRPTHRTWPNSARDDDDEGRNRYRHRQEEQDAGRAASPRQVSWLSSIAGRPRPEQRSASLI
jgi:short-subunit dehydrogenase